MLLNYRQLGASVSFGAILSLSMPVFAGGNLSISPDQKSATPSPQIEQESSNGLKAKTLESTTVNATSDNSVANTTLGDVPATSNAIIEIPVEINSDGTIDDSRFEGGALTSGDSFDGQPIDKLIIKCDIDMEAKPGAGEDAETLAAAERAFGGSLGGGPRKDIYLNEDGNFDGVVRFGFDLDFDTFNYTYKCYLSYPIGTVGLGNYAGISDNDSGFNTQVTGNIPAPGQ